MGHLSKLDDSGEVLLNKVFEKGFSLILSSQPPSPFPQASLKHLSIAVTNLLIGRAIFLLATGSSPHADSCLPTSGESPWFTWLNERKSN